MKNFVIFIITIFTYGQLFSQKVPIRTEAELKPQGFLVQEGLIPELGGKYNKYGYVNNDGELIIQYQYKEAVEFSEGLAVVRNYRPIYINKEGKRILSTNYDYAYNFYNGMACVMYNGKYGFINKKGDLVIPLEYDYAFNFSEDLVAVKKGYHFGYINKQGEVVIDFKYKKAFEFHNGVAAVWGDDYYYFINKKNEIISKKYNRIYFPVNGFYRIEGENDLLGFANLFGQEVISPKYLVAKNYSEGLAAVILADTKKLGYIDTTGRFVIKPKYKIHSYLEYEKIISLSNFVNGHAIVGYEDGEYFSLPYYLIDKDENIILQDAKLSNAIFNGDYAIIRTEYSIIIDKDGFYVSKPYDDIIPYTKQTYIAFKNKKQYLLDNTGKEISSSFDRIQKYSTGISLAYTKDKCVLLSHTGKTLSDTFYRSSYINKNTLIVSQTDAILPKRALLNTYGKIISKWYESINYFNNNIASAKNNGLYGYINIKGEEITPFIYSVVQPFKNEYAKVKQKGYYFFITKTGKKVSIDFDESYSSYTKNFNKSILIVSKGDKYTCLNENKKQITPWYNHIDYFNDDGYSIVTNNNKQAIIDTTGTVVSEWFQQITSNGDNFRIKQNNKFSFYNISKKKTIFYSYLGIESENRILVKLEDKYGYIDNSGKSVIGYSFSNAKKFTQGKAPVQNKDKWAYIDKNGKIIYEYKFDFAGNFYNGMAQVGKKTGNSMKYGYINENFELVIPYKYDDSWAFNKKYAFVKQNNYWFKIDKKGNVIKL